MCIRTQKPSLLVVSGAAGSVWHCHAFTAEWWTEIVYAVVHLLIHHWFNQALPNQRTLQLMTSYSQF